MKNHTKIFFLLFIFSTFFMIVSPLAPFANAGTVNNPVLTTDILAVEFGTFQDYTSGDGSGNLDSNKGGYDLISFENYGEVSRDLDTNTIVYGAKIKWGFEFNLWTSCSFNDIYPEIDINNIKEEMYLSYALWYRGSLEVVKYWLSNAQFYTNFNDIDYGSIYNEHDYHGLLPITVSIQPGLRFDGTLEIAGQEFTVPQLTSDILYTEIVSVRDGEVGGYEDRYIDPSGGGDIERTVSLSIQSGGFSTETEAIADWFSSLNWDITDFQNETRSVQNAITDPSEGRFDSTSTGNSFTFNLPVHLQPKVTKTQQWFRMRKGYFEWYSEVSPGWRAGPTSWVQRIQRDISVSTQNVFEHYDMLMCSDVFMTCQFSGELSETFLDDPGLKFSDMIWSTTIWGDENVDISLPAHDDSTWWIILLVVLILGVGLYVGYRIYKSRREQSFLLKLAGRGGF